MADVKDRRRMALLRAPDQTSRHSVDNTAHASIRYLNLADIAKLSIWRLYCGDSLHAAYDACHAQRQGFWKHGSGARKSVGSLDIAFLRNHFGYHVAQDQPVIARRSNDFMAAAASNGVPSWNFDTVSLSERCVRDL